MGGEKKGGRGDACFTEIFFVERGKTKKKNLSKNEKKGRGDMGSKKS